MAEITEHDLYKHGYKDMNLYYQYFASDEEKQELEFWKQQTTEPIFMENKYGQQIANLQNDWVHEQYQNFIKAYEITIPNPFSNEQEKFNEAVMEHYAQHGARGEIDFQSMKKQEEYEFSDSLF